MCIFVFSFLFLWQCISVGTSFTDLTKAIDTGKNIWHQAPDSTNIILSGILLLPEGTVASLQEWRTYKEQGGGLKLVALTVPGLSNGLLGLLCIQRLSESSDRNGMPSWGH